MLIRHFTLFLGMECWINVMVYPNIFNHKTSHFCVILSHVIHLNECLGSIYPRQMSGFYLLHSVTVAIRNLKKKKHQAPVIYDCVMNIFWCKEIMKNACKSLVEQLVIMRTKLSLVKWVTMDLFAWQAIIYVKWLKQAIVTMSTSFWACCMQQIFFLG